MTHYTDEYGLTRSAHTGLTAEGRRVPAGTTAEEYRAQLDEESARFVAAAERQSDPRAPRPQPSRLPTRYRLSGGKQT